MKKTSAINTKNSVASIHRDIAKLLIDATNIDNPIERIEIILDSGPVKVNVTYLSNCNTIGEISGLAANLNQCMVERQPAP